MPPTNIALITCSTRQPRLNPFIINYIHDVLQQKLPSISGIGITLSIIDLSDQHLPLYNEPAVPSHLPSSNPTPHYKHEHTRAWSELIKQYDAFIFVTPQYNWSIPAVLKNALDYLFYEWRGKSAGVVTYGGRGGGKAGGHLQQILRGLRMRPAVCMPGLVVKGDMLEGCLATGTLAEDVLMRWREAGVEEQVQGMFKELVEGCR
ncbi:flavin-dependent quinone reductase [Aspergillus stella-maris]|uniref:flavin-dependent quinone reductase n=1 Tax=Aspergillus stella-maris TaxID=1810926 RepID=UPI003CCD2499